MDIGSYITGYVDGEGCFTVSFSPRRALLVGWEVRPSFSASQNADRSEVLQLMQEYFGCGRLRPDRSDRTIKYEVRGIADLNQRVLPHFDRYPLISSKRTDYMAFAAVCRLVSSGVHLSVAGLREIVGLTMTMNASGKRKFAAAHIIGPTPEDIVSAARNGGLT